MGKNRNATSIWSGYSHQGFVGIFVALYEILRIYESKAGDSDENIENELKKYKLVFENAEDFDIQCENEVISRHQVKAYKKGIYKSGYKNAISAFKTEDIDPNIPCYMHVICDVSDWNTYSDDNFDNKKGKENNKRIQLYEYDFSLGKQKFCPLFDKNIYQEFHGVINQESQNIIAKIREEKYKRLNSEGNLKELYQLLHDKVSVEHQNGGCPEMSFEEIIKIIKNDLNADDIYISRLICKYISEYEKFITGIKESDDFSESDKTQIIHFFDVLKDKLFSKDNVGLLKMLEGWHIHKGLKEDFSTHGFESILLYFCKNFFQKDINSVNNERVEEFLLDEKRMKFTAITEEERKISGIVKDIQVNIDEGRFTQDYFNGIQLITERIDNKEDFGKISQLLNSDEKQMNFTVGNINENRDNINKPIKFTFISRDTALGRI